MSLIVLSVLVKNDTSSTASVQGSVLTLNYSQRSHCTWYTDEQDYIAVKSVSSLWRLDQRLGLYSIMIFNYIWAYSLHFSTA